jgi:Cu-Zn family superoxide dismutase
LLDDNQSGRSNEWSTRMIASIRPSRARLCSTARLSGAAVLAHLALLAGCAPPSPGLESAAATDDPAGNDRAGDAGNGAAADAILMPTAGQSATGIVRFRLDDDGEIEILADLTGLKAGEHGIHIHEIGDCSAPDASSAGDHFSPDGDPHGSPDAGNDAHHAGDLGNVTADGTGAASQVWRDDELSLIGRYGIVGRAVILLGGPDDLKSQPSGESGPPVACGVILAADAAPARPPA